MTVLGTAGHVDHGKSTLVRALTGTDPDTLAAEQSTDCALGNTSRVSVYSASS